MRQVRRWGRRIRWSSASFDNETGESYSLKDGPQRKMMEENEALKCRASSDGWCPPISV